MSLLNPANQVLIYSLAYSLLIAVIYRLTTNPTLTREIKAKIKENRNNLNQAKKSGNKSNVDSLFSESLALNKQLMSSMGRPLVVSVLLFMLFFYFISSQFEGLVVNLPFSLPILDLAFPFIHLVGEYSWFWWYILITIPGTVIFRKLLGVD